MPMPGGHPFSELRAKMSPAVQPRAEVEAAELRQHMDDIPADPINVDDILAELSPERRAEVLERGRQLIAEERAGVTMMDVRPIRTEADYDWALEQIEHYFDNEPELGTPEADRFDVLWTLIKAYEDQHYPIRDVGLFERIISWVRKRFSKRL
jgi:hypothetical protein